MALRCLKGNGLDEFKRFQTGGLPCSIGSQKRKVGRDRREPLPREGNPKTAGDKLRMVLKSHWWWDMTTQDFAGLDAERVVAILPVGAIEQHGPHLPVRVD